uniref:PLA2c domain-containing protein n=1 Tax=Hucho hucho TaxID=62062 RepID=A0A4W5KRF8_9TELE
YSVSHSFCQTVRLSHSINDEERKYVKGRKTLIKKWLKDQGVYCELVGSGGERAAVGMLGSLHQLAQDDLLGSLHYMCGVSGTTWCMSSLYSDPALSLGQRCDEMIKKLKGSTVDLSKAVDWLKLRKEQNQDFNLTDFWGAFTASYFIKEMHTRCLSDDAHVNKPYPIYSAIELDCHRQNSTEGDWVWFEMTPHECGFSGLGASIPTSCLGSKFEGGTLREKRKEMDMVLLQGICGSAIADGQRNIAEVVKKIWGLFGGKPQCSMLQLSCLSLSLPPRSLSSPSVSLYHLSLCVSLSSPSVSFHHPPLLSLYTQSPPLSLPGHSLSLYPPSLSPCTLPLYPALPIYLSITSDTNVPSSMASKEKIHLVDAGLKINSPYPPVLRTSRKVDLIISLDFSEGNPFEANTHTHFVVIFHVLFLGEEGMKKERETYTTLQQHYGAPEIEHLLKKAKDNLKNNKYRILEQIFLAVKRRQNRKSVAQ